MLLPVIGGMLGRSNGPAVIVSSCFEESTATRTVGAGCGRTGPDSVEATRNVLHSMDAALRDRVVKIQATLRRFLRSGNFPARPKQPNCRWPARNFLMREGNVKHAHAGGERGPAAPRSGSFAGGA